MCKVQGKCQKSGAKYKGNSKERRKSQGKFKKSGAKYKESSKERRKIQEKFKRVAKKPFVCDKRDPCI